MSKIPCKTWQPRFGPFKYAHHKLDGIWLEFTRDNNWNGELQAFTSHPTNITEQIKTYPWFFKVSSLWWFDCKVYGELHVPGKPASYVKTAIKHLDPALTFTAFATDRFYADTPLEQVRDQFKSCEIDFARCESNPHDIVNGHKSLPFGVEGLVFKNGNLLDWHKWKPDKTVDAVVVGIKEGTGKNLGLIGALICQVEGRTVASVSGMTDEERILMSDLGDDVIGQVVEVAYQYVGAKGRLRHPRFYRLRDDKQPDECLLSQDPDLLEYWT